MEFRQQARALVSRMTLEEKCGMMQYQSPAVERLGIPAYTWWNEGLHGVARAGCATVFPQAIAMAASFDEALLQQVAHAIAVEARAKYNAFRTFGDTGHYEGLTYWSPNINIFRDPRWGRGQETYGEDPTLTGRLGTAFVRGLQGDGKYRVVDATLKHFAVHSGPERLRHTFDARPTERDLYETYLAAFRYCIAHAHPAAVMGAYNRLNGESCCASRRLLQDVLRGELGFDGYVVSDCGAICDMYRTHRITRTPEESAALAAQSGCDLNCGEAYNSLLTAVQEGLLPEETVTRSAERLLEARLRLGLFADDCPYDAIGTDVLECDAHKALNLQMAHESIVLLQNNGILPLRQGMRVAVIGPNADSRDVLLGNYNGYPSEYTTILRGIQELSEGTVLYAQGCCRIAQDTPQEDHALMREAVLRAARSDVVVMVMGISPRLEGEEGDAMVLPGFDGGDKTTLELPHVQRTLYEQVLSTGKPIVFVHVSGSCMALTRQAETADAVVQCFYPGAMGGKALAQILFGVVSPCGRLPVTFYRSTDDLPDFEDYSMEGRTYRYFRGTPLYRFGHGLTYGEIVETWEDARTVRLENKGAYSVHYTVLRYADATRRRLVDFRKQWLRPHETVRVTFKNEA